MSPRSLSIFSSLVLILALSWGSEGRCQAQPTGKKPARASQILSQMGPGSEAPKEASPEDGMHQVWDALLRKHVQAGWVSYQGFQNEEAELDSYLKILAETDPQGLSREGQLAFWINAYNAFTVKLILRRYPKLESIRDFWGPWKKKDWVVHGKKMSLDDIEHGTIRADFQDPRIHAAVNCASKSCPDLLSEAFVPSRLEAQLDGALRGFLADSEKGLKFGVEKGYLYGSSKVLRLSKIFDWYGKDFGSNQAEVLEALAPYFPAAAQDFWKTHQEEISVKYLGYDWTLNGD